MSDESNKSPPSGTLVCTRAIARQGTSYMAFRGEQLEPGDPLLGFRPVPHKAPRRNSIVPARQRAFVAALAASGIVTDAARHIGASVEALYKLRNRPGAEEFRAAWDAAIDRGVARLEDTALARAIAGEERMVVSHGQVLGTEMRHNENLVMFFLRNRRPERYGNSVREHDLKPGHPTYERIRKEVLAEDAETEEETRASIVRFLEDMRERRLANEKVLAAFEAEDSPDEDGGGDDGGDGGGPEAETSPEPPVDTAGAEAAQARSDTMAQQGKRQGQPGGEDRQQNPQGGAAGQAGRDTGKARQQNQEGQNQSAPDEGEGGRPGQQNDLAGMQGQEVERGG